MKQIIKNELADLKNHLFLIISVLVKYFIPIIYVIVTYGTTKSERHTLSLVGIIVIGVLVLIYYGLIRRLLTRKKTEERLVNRIAPEKAKPLSIILFTFLDDVVCLPLIPAIIWCVCDVLQSVSADISLSFLAITILFVIGGVFQLIDVIINLSKQYEE